MNTLREAHAHIASHGRSLLLPSLASATGADDMLSVAALHAARTPAGGWLLMVGARVESWTQPGNGPSSWPSLREFDDATGPVPALAMSFDHHMVMANSAALSKSGITPASTPPPGGVISFDAHGQPTGLLLETAAWAVWSKAPEPTPQEMRLHVIAALRDLARHGFGEVHDMLSAPWLGPVLAELSDAGDLPLRVRIYAPLDSLRDVHAASSRWARPDVMLGGGKIFIDGTLNSRTAWMLHPYREAQQGLPTGKVVTPPDEIRTALEFTRSLSTGLAAHAIGDAAVRAALDAFEAVNEVRMDPSKASFVPASPLDPQNPAFRIEHAEVIDAHDTPRFARLGVLASIQPCHLLADIEALHRYIPHRLDRVFPLRELIDAGCLPGDLLWFGSDTPIVRPDPQDSIQAAVNRRRASCPPSDSIAPDQRISPEEAWRSFALGA